MSFATDLFTPATLAQVRAQIISFAQSAGLAITSWASGGLGEQTLEYTSNAVTAQDAIIASMARGYGSLETATDPGDPDPYDPENVLLPAAPGYLSYLGLNTYACERQEETFATGFGVLTNNTGAPLTITADSLVFAWTGGSPPTPAPTYTNSYNAAFYTNPDGSLTIADTGSHIINFTCQTLGPVGSAPANVLTLVTVVPGLTVANAALVGLARESAPVYRTRCREAAARLSLGAPAQSYDFLAAHTITGAPLDNANGVPVAITRVYVSPSSTIGTVTVYYASQTGPASTADVTAANLNISTYAYAVQGSVNFGPLTGSDPGGPGGAPAVAHNIGVSGTLKVPRNPSMTDAALIALVKAAIVTGDLTTGTGLPAYMGQVPIGGYDQTAGSGKVYKTDIAAAVKDSYPGLYNVTLATPAGDTTLALGEIPVSTSIGSNWTVSVTP